MTLGAAIGHGLLGLGSRGSVCISDRGRVVVVGNGSAVVVLWRLVKHLTIIEVTDPDNDDPLAISGMPVASSFS